MLIATDLDGSLALGDKEDILKVNSLFEQYDLSVVYVTGRDIKKFRELTKNIYKNKGVKLHPPDYLVTLNGVRIYKFRKPYVFPLKKYWVYRKWYKIIKSGWNKKVCREAFNETANKIRFDSDLPALVEVKYKVSPYHLESVIHYEKIDLIQQTLKEECQKRNIKVNIIFDYIEKKHVDIGLKILNTIDTNKANIVRKMRDEHGALYVMMPCATSKGEAINYIRTLMGFKKSEVIAAGDGGNDYQLLTQGFKSIVVNNAHKILLKDKLDMLSEEEKSTLYFVNSEGAKGLLEGLSIILDEAFPHGSDSGLRSVINA